MADTTIIGNIGEPALKFTPSGKAVLEFSLAENHSKKNASGGWDEDGTTWRRVAIWDKKAETLAEHLKKGDRVIVTGAERIREWESKDGAKGQSLEVNAREVGIVPRASAQQRTQQADAWGTPSGGSGGWGAPSSEVPF
jgi:single-strand DNA-binding protein